MSLFPSANAILDDERGPEKPKSEGMWNVLYLKLPAHLRKMDSKLFAVSIGPSSTKIQLYSVRY